MNPNNHNRQFQAPSPEDGQPPQAPGPQQPYSGPPQMPAPQPQPYNPQPTNSGPGNQLPEQQYGAPTSGQHEQYDFIMKSAPGKKKIQLGVPGNNSLAMRVATISIGLVMLIVGFGIFSAILNRPKFSTTALVGVAQQQQELVRVAGIGALNSHSQNILNSANTIKLGVGSEEQQLVTYLAKNHAGLNVATLNLKLNKQTDARLNAAAAASTFDSTYTDIIQSLLATYQASLKTAYSSNPGPNGQKLLASQYKSATLLLAQSKQQ